MSRRVRLPGADELFRPTKAADPPQADQPSPAAAASPPAPSGSSSATGNASEAENGKRGSSGRVRHDEKITVYVTADELIDLEHTRLAMRREHGLAVDRGRIVREAIRLALESVERDGDESPLVRRLREQ